MRNVVVASADAQLRKRLSSGLTSLNWSVREAAGGAEAFALLDNGTPTTLVMDPCLSDLEPNSFKSYLKANYPEIRVVDLSKLSETPRDLPGHAEIMRFMREVCKPIPTDGASWVAAPSHLGSAFSGQKGTLPSDRSAQTGAQAFETIEDGPLCDPEVPELIGTGPEMQELRRLIHLVAPLDARVLIEGETGTGKELVARALHKLSLRSGKPLVTLNCAAIPEALLESELFGHSKGAFTGAVQTRVGRIEAADGGTLFLDEVGELSLPLQAKLLRFLENGELQRVGENATKTVNVRVIAATHQQLDKRVEDGLFRLDLLHRLSVFPIEVPPLRERKQDIVPLVSHILRELKCMQTLSGEAMNVLVEHTWPGNVRELKHVVERATILAQGKMQIEMAAIKLRRAPRG